MAIKIAKMVVDVPGQVLRKFDKDTKVTTLVVDDDQARALFDQLSPVLAFFDAQGGNGHVTAEKGGVKFSG
jgi:hypothetical protein